MQQIFLLWIKRLLTSHLMTNKRPNPSRGLCESLSWQARPSKAIMLVLDYSVFVWALLGGSYWSSGIFYRKKNKTKHLSLWEALWLVNVTVCFIFALLVYCLISLLYPHVSALSLCLQIAISNKPVRVSKSVDKCSTVTGIQFSTIRDF